MEAGTCARPSSTESLAEVHTWIDNHPKTKHGVHEYTPEMFGLTTADLHRRFSFYIDRFGITTT